MKGVSHEAGFKTGLTRVINDYARKMNLIKENDENPTGEDVRGSLTRFSLSNIQILTRGSNQD